MSKNNVPRNETVISSSSTRISACKKYLVSAKTEVPIAGQLTKVPAIVSVYQKSLDTRSAVAEARAALVEALAERDAAETARQTTDEALKSWVLQRFGEDSKAARDFGYTPKKVTAKSADTKANAASLAKATRTARGTVGKKQKLKVKGTLPVPTAPAAPATNPAPAPATAPAVVAPAPVVAPSAPAAAPASSSAAAAEGGGALNGAAHG